ncbi:MAG: A/G-specific adenine glycosylase [Candidatus Nitricoxidivorans perseverans]|uniref:Adenine DNA glycosylase n=1 Tax=Candidatus Nitricoxidivorans perseverans TaxID=2975601 RepID=A0AA49J0I5_9PROT|nr:MAG: A/G-specific adenine glycosylase [Candidatus Nitricoxidivorans perseverans]
MIRWQKAHGRHDLPWQGTKDPYRVWLSEIMLQQTQVATVIPYYERFLARFPALADLAAAPVEEVMALWSGLGYYARARNLHACARAVAGAHGGRFPRDAEAIAQLSGIGRSTANAIAVFCFGAHAPILDGNVKRVLCRHAGIDGFPGAPAVEGRLWGLAGSLLPKGEAATYIQAQMDLGATVCTRSSPRCGACPVAEDCAARIGNRIGELPAPRPRKALPERASTVLVLVAKGRVLLEPRPPAGIWGGLLSLPEVPEGATPADHAARLGCRIRSSRELPAVRHGFTHFRLTLSPLLCEVVPLPRVSEQSQRWLDGGELARAPLPAPIRKILSGIP